MTTLFWVLIVLHVFLCLFLALLVLVQNDLHPEVDPCRCCDFLHRGFRS